MIKFSQFEKHFANIPRIYLSNFEMFTCAQHRLTFTDFLENYYSHPKLSSPFHAPSWSFEYQYEVFATSVDKFEICDFTRFPNISQH
ncbi:hypothetical protein T03_3944 [Trichinella britovi]|uniref:Uncharacterized protein n=1 Tax=Trichinella britovi TaxID=45882 RepID=A0A0V1CLQ2_TRIBR|nr:hypothetical protein T03_3944 [Trichinella britovi]